MKLSKFALDADKSLQEQRLIVAAILEKGNLNQVKDLVNKGLKDIVFEGNKNPLHFAAANQNPQIMSYLIEELKLEPDAQLKNTPLLVAARHGNWNVIKLLIELNADPKKTNSAGWDVAQTLEECCHYQLLEPLRVLIASQHNISSSANVSDQTLTIHRRRQGDKDKNFQRSSATSASTSSARINSQNSFISNLHHSLNIGGPLPAENKPLLKKKYKSRTY